MQKIFKKIKYNFSKYFYFLIQPKMLAFKKNFQKRRVNNLRIGNTTFIDYKENLFLGDNVYIGHYNFIEASNNIKIKNGCQITNFVTLTSHSSHNSIRYYGSNYSKISNHKAYLKGPIEIGEFTYVGPYSTIMPNSKIGKGCVISAYSFIKGEFEDFSIISGNPAKKIGDVRDNDNKFIEENPELKEFYMK